MNTLNEDRAVIVGEGTLKVALSSNGKYRMTLRKKVVTNGIIAGNQLCEELGIDRGTLRGIVAGMKRILRAGYEVRFGLSEDDAIRLYPCLNDDYSRMFVAAATVGDDPDGIRECVSDLEWNLYRKGEKIGSTTAKKEENKKAKEVKAAKCVTPDTMVTCPECGCEFRVGKVLACEK